jgi:hypothetical protein
VTSHQEAVNIFKYVVPRELQYKTDFSWQERM